MALIDELRTKLTAVADTIRAKTGKAELMTLDDMPAEIRSLKAVVISFEATRGAYNGQKRAGSTSFDSKAHQTQITCTVIKAESKATV